jgi:hypothetical protein
VRVKLLGVVAALVLSCPACASDQSGGEPTAKGAHYWARHSAGAALEVDRPLSIAVLAQRSDVVVLGRVSASGDGRDYSQPGKGPNKTVNLTVASAQSAPSKAGYYVLEIDASPTAEVGDIPDGDYVFYLTKWYVGADGTQVYRCTSAALCVIGGSPLSTVRAPEAAVDLQGLSGTLESLYAASAAVVAKR